MRKTLVKLAALIAVAAAGVWLWEIGGITPEAADGALEMPADGPVDFRFDSPTDREIRTIPTALRFDPPLGHLIYNAQKFWDMNKNRGGHHTGDDLNGIGGMNTDLGDPVFATADGLVTFAAESSPGWGKIVIVAHRLPDGRIVESMYAHLSRIATARGKLVARGERIGAVGTANGHYPAHLHFEMRAAGNAVIGGGYALDPLNHLDPAATVASLRHTAPDDFSPSPLGVALAAE